MSAVIPEVERHLRRAQERGFIGDGPLAPHLAHARSFLPHLPSSGSVADLGTGGGLPGLVLAAARPDLQWVFIEGAVTRAAFLEEVARDLGLVVEVLAERAEDAGHGPLRATFAAVTARSFGAPAVVAECAAPLLTAGGRLVVSEPPDVATASRWPVEGVAQLGFGPPRTVEGPPRFVVLAAERPCPGRYPRRVGVPAKRPLF